jgi:hypothetical protein
VDPKVRLRLAITHRILDAIRTETFRSETLATSAGEHVIMPALPDDTMAPFFDKLRQTGEPVHIATVHNEDLVVFTMVPCKPGRHAGRQVDPEDKFPVSPDMSIGIVLDYLILREKPILIREASPQVCLELVERPASDPHPRPRGPRGSCGDPGARHVRIP